MPETAPQRARIAVFVSGRGSNMAALLYASRFDDAPYEIALVASNDPGAEALALAEAEGIATFALSHKGMTRRWRMRRARPGPNTSRSPDICAF